MMRVGGWRRTSGLAALLASVLIGATTHASSQTIAWHDSFQAALAAVKDNVLPLSGHSGIQAVSGAGPRSTNVFKGSAAELSLRAQRSNLMTLFQGLAGCCVTSLLAMAQGFL